MILTIGLIAWALFWVAASLIWHSGRDWGKLLGSVDGYIAGLEDGRKDGYRKAIKEATEDPYRV